MLIFIVAIILYRILLSVALYRRTSGIIRSQASSVASITASVFNLIMILIMGRIYEKLALKLTQWGKSTVLAALWLFWVGQKSKADNFCNNFVCCRPIFIISAHVHYKKFATRGCIVSPSNVVCVTALPCKILIRTLPICLYTTINHNEIYEKSVL